MSEFTLDLVESDVKGTVAQVEKTMASLDSLLVNVNSGNGSLGKLINDRQLYTEMSESMSQLELLLEDMRLNPKRYVHFSLFGRKSSELDTIN